MSRDKPSSERAPMCPICSVRHWAREAHVFGKKAAAKPAVKTGRRK